MNDLFSKLFKLNIFLILNTSPPILADTFSIYRENDGPSYNHSDRHYTSGLEFHYTRKTKNPIAKNLKSNYLDKTPKL